MPYMALNCPTVALQHSDWRLVWILDKLSGVGSTGVVRSAQVQLGGDVTLKAWFSRV